MGEKRIGSTAKEEEEARQWRRAIKGGRKERESGRQKDGSRNGNSVQELVGGI